MSELDFVRIIFSSVMSMQYHPRNVVLPEDDPVVIERCLRITDLARIAFYNYFVLGEKIPF